MKGNDCLFLSINLSIYDSGRILRSFLSSSCVAEWNRGFFAVEIFFAFLYYKRQDPILWISGRLTHEKKDTRKKHKLQIE